MAIQNYFAAVLVVAAVSTLFLASPFLAPLLVIPKTDPISELYLLGPMHNTTYTYWINNYQNYRLYVDVINHEYSQSSYVIQIKFRSQLQAQAETFTKTQGPSSQPALTKLPFQLPDNASKEIPIDVSFHYNGTNTTINIQSLNINGVNYGPLSPLTNDGNGYRGNLVFELWMFDSSQNSFVYKCQVSLCLRLS
jgi:hypothetical protein